MSESKPYETWEEQLKVKLAIPEFEEALIKFGGHEESFEEVWKELNAKDGKEVYQILIDLYQKPKRAYHNITHIAYMLDGLTKIEQLAENINELKIAIWFHDVIYEPTKTNNEEESAKLAYKLLIEKGASEDCARKVQNLVMATKYTIIAKTNDEKLISDLDLAVLGLSKEIFIKYSDLLHQEYGFEGEEIYWKNRKIILERYVVDKNLFYHSYFKKRYEKQAIENLKFGIKEAKEKIIENSNLAQ